MNTDEQEQTHADDDRDDVPAVDDGFRVKDEQSANWVVRKITESRRYAGRVRAWAAVEIRRAEREEAFFLSQFGDQLTNWCRRQLAERGNRQRSINLPAARVGLRRVQPVIEIVDPAKTLAWCRATLPSAISVTERIAKSALTEFLAATGEIPDGTELRTATERLCITQHHQRSDILDEIGSTQ